jgi:16S rRNA (uracil1498-N3)-methyltransferase
MNHLIFSEQDIEKNQSDELIYTLTSPDSINHLLNVIKVEINQSYKAILMNSGLCEATCRKIEPNKVSFSIKNLKRGEERGIDLLIGLSRPQAVKKILEYCSGQPINKIIFYTAELSEKSYATSKVFQVENINELLTQGLSQCGRFQNLPTIEVLKYLPENLIKNYQDKFVLSLDSHSHVLDYSTELTNHPLIAIGPERGFTTQELDQFKDLEFKDILLSPSILRVETAIIALCSQLELLNFQK